MDASNNRKVNPHSLLDQAFEALQNDMQDMAQSNKEEMQTAMSEMAEKMDAMHKVTEAMKSNLEFMHKQVRDNNKKVETLTQKVKDKEEETERLVEEIKQLKADNAEKITELEEEIGKVGGNPVTIGGSNTSQSYENTNGVDESTTSNGAIKVEESGGKEKNFTFEKDVTGKNVIIGTETAAIGEGSELRFTQPLKNDPNALTNYQGMINENDKDHLGTSGNADSLRIPEALKDSTLVGNEKVNIQANTQNVYLAGQGPSKIEVDENGEPVKYRQADTDELADFLEQNRRDADSREDDADAPPLNPNEVLQKRDVILRVAKELHSQWNPEKFIRLTKLLLPLTHSQLLSLSPQLMHITSVDLSGLQVHFDLLHAFYRCFRSKGFRYLSLSRSQVNAADVQKLASALHTNKIQYLDLSNCSYEYMAFFNLASLLPHVDEISMRGLTQATIIPESGLSRPRLFSAEDAQHLAESVLRSDRMLGLDLSNCNFTDGNTLTVMCSMLGKVDRLVLKNATISIEGIKLVTSQMPRQIQRLDLSCIELRGAGVEVVCGSIERMKILQLSNVMIDDANFTVLLDALSKLPEQAMEVLDVSFNSIDISNVSKLVKLMNKIRLVIFSEKQIKLAEVDGILAEDLEGGNVPKTISEVVNGHICRPENLRTDGFTHWVAFGGTVDDRVRKHVMDLTIIPQQEVATRNIPEYRCRKCKTHIAFTKDAIMTPCAFLYNDRKLFGLMDKPFFATVSHATSCIPNETKKPKKHVCSASKCRVAQYKMQKYVCAKCGQTVGGLYTDKNNSQNRFWCLYQETQNALDIGSKKKLPQLF